MFTFKLLMVYQYFLNIHKLCYLLDYVKVMVLKRFITKWLSKVLMN